MSIDRAIPGSTDPTAVQQPIPTQYAPAGLGTGYDPGFGPSYGQGYGGPPAYGFPQPPPPPAGRRTGVIVAAVVAVVLVLAGIGAGAWFLLVNSNVDPEAVSKEIVRVTEQNDKVTPTDVRCPSDVPFEAGRTFTCTATLLSKPVTYTITQNDDKGAITINYTRPVLDAESVQKEVVRVTANELGVTPSGVECPSDVRFEKGGTFTCSATIEGQALNYQITQTDDKGGLNIAHDRVLSAQEIGDQLAAQLTRDVGEQVVAVCGSEGQTLIVNAPGQPIRCGAANAANPSRNAPVTVTVDAGGTLSYTV